MQRLAKLKRFAYTDGTVFYLARSEAELEDKTRLCLGPYVWRMANGKDGLWDANVGPSLYAKAQGKPVKIWGFFADGRLEYWVLPEDGRGHTTHMNGARYNQLVGTRFAQWRRACFGDDNSVHLVQDHEKCLWQERNQKALRRAGCLLVENFPKGSPDPNVIETWWNRLRQKLEANAPVVFEGRSQFLARLRRTVRWLNQNCREEALKCCNSQKARAKNVLELKGARTHW